jgi:hypothetical protein
MNQNSHNNWSKIGGTPIQIPEQVKGFNTDVCAFDAAFQETPEILHSVGVNIPFDVAFRLVNRFVDILIFQSTIRQQVVGINL